MKKSFKLLSALLSMLFVGSVAGLIACNGGGSKENTLGEVPYNAEFLSQAEDEIHGYNNNLFYVNTLDFEVADPTIIYITEEMDKEEAGYFYAYGTSDEIGCHGFQAWRSKDLSHWECTGVAFEPDFSVAWAHSNYWAPEIIYDNGLYYLFYNAFNAKDNNVLYLSVAYSRSPKGPFLSPDGRKNANGEMLSAGAPVFDFTTHNPVIAELAKNDPALIREQALDASPFIDPETGDKYMYFSYYNNYGEGSFIYGVKMIDWFTPDYSTLTMITVPGYKTIAGWKSGALDERLTEGSVNEGPYMVYRDGKYYLTLSIFGYTDPNYRVIHAISDSPLGLFTKLGDNEGGRVVSTNPTWNHMVSAGHHCFFNVGEELFIGYHTFKNRNSISGGRALAVDRVIWTENQNGLPVMHTNGPTWSVQALPEFISGYKNVATSATVTANNTASGSDVALLNDELVKYQDLDVVNEYVANEGRSVIKLSWNEWKTVRGIMIHNSYDYEKTFVSIAKIEFEVKNSKGRTATATISDLGFDWDWNASGLYMKPGGAAIAEFNEMPVKSITITIDSVSGSQLAIGEIFVLGKDDACAGIDKFEDYSYETHSYGSPHVEKDSLNFGDVKGSSLSTMWGYDLSHDDGTENAYIEQNGCFDQYGYFKEVYSNTFYVEAEFTVTSSQSFAGDAYPKFGIAISTDDTVNNTIFFYVDAVNYTNQVVGCAQRLLDNSDWDWNTTEQLVTMPGIRYTNDQYVKLSVLRIGEKFYMMCNDQLVIYYDQFQIFNDVRKAATGFLSFNTPMKIRNYSSTTDETVIAEKEAKYANFASGETFGQADSYKTTTGWDLSGDRGENPVAVNATAGDQYAYFNGVYGTEVYAETDITVSKDFGDPYPKFGIALRSANNTFFFYIDGSGAYSNQAVGWVTRNTSGDWAWSAAGKSGSAAVNLGSYSNGDTVKLAILRSGATIKCYVDDVLVFTVSDVAGLSATDNAACAILSFTTGVTVSNYGVITDANAIAEKESTLQNVTAGGGETFGSAGTFSTTAGWDLSKDNATDRVIVNESVGDQYAFFKDINSTEVMAQIEISATKDLGDLYPKFGLILCTGTNSFFFFIDATNGYTNQSVGWVTDSGSGWSWNTAVFTTAELGEYKDGKTAKLSIKRVGANIQCYVNDVMVFEINDLAGFDANTKAACAVLSFTTGVTVSNYSASADVE